MQTLKGLAAAVMALGIMSCGNEGSAGSKDSTSNSASNAKPEDGFYFKYTVDGKEFSVAEADVSSSYNSSDSTLKIFSGKDGETSLMVIIPHVATCPCKVPAGSVEPGSLLSQGSVSLQNYPEKGRTWNNFDFFHHAAPSPATDAVNITSNEKAANGEHVITGNINTVGLKGSNDPNGKDVVIKGSFKVKAEKSDW